MQLLTATATGDTSEEQGLTVTAIGDTSEKQGLTATATCNTGENQDLTVAATANTGKLFNQNYLKCKLFIQWQNVRKVAAYFFKTYLIFFFL